MAQLGAREHYAVPRALHRRAQLRGLFTDAYCARGRRWFERGPALLRSFAARHHPDLPRDRVVSFTSAAVLERLRRGHFRGRADEYEAYVAEGRAFAQRVARAVCALELDSSQDAFFGYDTGALEVIEALAARGVPSVVDQIDPGPVEERLVVEERARWPGWEPDTGRIPDVYWDRLRAEWAAADRVVVNSEWSRSALVREGVPERKLIVVPLAFEAPRGVVASPRERRRGTLRILWLGSVVLRKGIPYLLEAARRLLDRDVDFVVAGPVQISPAAVAGAPRNVRFVGRVTRDATAAMYDAADVFVLPTISDGFAITQLEALAHGVPVIATPNCAAVVTPGLDGSIVPAGDADALAAAIAQLDDDRALLAEMSVAAPRTAARYSVDRLGDALGALLEPGGATAP